MISIDEKPAFRRWNGFIRPGRWRRVNPKAVEFEYMRHGTQALIANFDVATGQVIAPTVGDTHTEED